MACRQHGDLGASGAQCQTQKLGRRPTPRERTFLPTGLPTLHSSPPRSFGMLRHVAQATRRQRARCHPSAASQPREACKRPRASSSADMAPSSQGEEMGPGPRPRGPEGERDHRALAGLGDRTPPPGRSPPGRSPPRTVLPQDGSAREPRAAWNPEDLGVSGPLPHQEPQRPSHPPEIRVPPNGVCAGSGGGQDGGGGGSPLEFFFFFFF